jgi:hypothetical protein
VVKVHELGDSEEGPFLVTELVDGQSLDARSDGNPMPPREAAEIAHGLAAGLAAIHAAGVVHRDLKPGNVMLRPDGSPVLLDFGLARGAESGDRLTQTGMLTGTPSYMAPEQATGETTKNPDPRTDVYGLGATLYTLLTGEVPFWGSAIQILVSIVQTSPEWPGVAALPQGLVAITRKAMAREPESRHGTADALRIDLELWLAGNYRPERSLTKRALAGGAAALVFVIAAGVGVLRSGESPPPPVEPTPAPVTSEALASLPESPEVRPIGRWKRVERYRSPRGVREGPAFCRFVSDTRIVCVNSWSQEALVWDLGSESPARVFDLPSLTRAIEVGGGRVSIVLSTDLVVLHLDLSGRVPETFTEFVLEPDSEYEDGTSLRAVVLDDEGELAVVGDANGRLSVLELSSGSVVAEEHHSATNGVAALAIHDDVLVSTSGATDGVRGEALKELDFRVRFWSLPNLTANGQFRIPAIGSAVCLLPGSGDVVVGTKDGRIQRWTREGVLVASLKGTGIIGTGVASGGGRFALGADQPKAHTYTVEELRVGAGRLYSIGRSSWIRRTGIIEFSVWNLETGAEIVAFPGVAGRSVSDVALSPDGRKALIGFWGGEYELWER